MKSKAGYTLIHMLAAIAVIGLTASSVAQAVFGLARQQTRATETVARFRSEQGLQRAFAAMMQSAGDYATLSGGTGHFQIDCKGGPCGADILSSGGRFVLALRSREMPAQAIDLPGPVRFRYQTLGAAADRWPSDDPYAPLAGISLELVDDAGAKPLAYARARSTQPRDCEYDSVIRDCRATNP